MRYCLIGHVAGLGFYFVFLYVFCPIACKLKTKALALGWWLGVAITRFI